MWQQSEATDLLGGYRPVTIDYLMSRGLSVDIADFARQNLKTHCDEISVSLRMLLLHDDAEILQLLINNKDWRRLVLRFRKCCAVAKCLVPEKISKPLQRVAELTKSSKQAFAYVPVRLLTFFLYTAVNFV